MMLVLFGIVIFLLVVFIVRAQMKMRRWDEAIKRIMDDESHAG